MNMLSSNSSLIDFSEPITQFNEDLDRANNILFELTNIMNWVLKHDIRYVDYNLILEKFGTIVDVTSAYFFTKIHLAPKFILDSIWMKNLGVAGISTADVDNFDILKLYILKKNCFTGSIYDVPIKEQQILARLGIKSLAVIPIIGVSDSITGFVGFNDCEKERIWGEIELNALRSLGVVIGTIHDKKIQHNKHATEILNAVTDLRKIRQSLDLANEELQRKLK